jgi:RNA polymerase sigma-70 factor (ECF subfamily)
MIAFDKVDNTRTPEAHSYSQRYPIEIEGESDRVLEQDGSSAYGEPIRSLEGATDESLVLVAQSGDHSAFLELRKRHANKLLLRVYRITRSWEDAEDVLQESFLRAFMHLGTFERRSSFSSWLTRIAINSALMVLRKRRGIEISIDSMIGDGESEYRWELPDRRKNPEEAYAQQEIEGQLRTAIDRLSPQLRKAIQMRQEKDCSDKEVASALGISLPAAKSRLLRAKVTLRSSRVWCRVAPRNRAG